MGTIYRTTVIPCPGAGLISAQGGAHLDARVESLLPSTC